MPVFVKAHRRGKSVVKAYKRSLSMMVRYNTKQQMLNPESAFTLRRRRSTAKAYFKADKVHTMADRVLKAKFEAGKKLLGGRRAKSGNVYALKAALERQFTR